MKTMSLLLITLIASTVWGFSQGTSCFTSDVVTVGPYKHSVGCGLQWKYTVQCDTIPIVACIFTKWKQIRGGKVIDSMSFERYFTVKEFTEEITNGSDSVKRYYGVRAWTFSLLSGVNNVPIQKDDTLSFDVEVFFVDLKMRVIEVDALDPMYWEP